MSVLTTRIGGVKFAISTQADGSVLGQFVGDSAPYVVPEDGTVAYGDLPFWLRAVYHQQQGQTLPLLAAATEAAKNQQNEDSWHYTSCEDEFCERCDKFSAHLDRMYAPVRGQQFRVFATKNMDRTARIRRADRAIINCNICQNINGLCDSHAMQRRLAN